MTSSLSERALRRSAFFQGIANIHLDHFGQLRQTTSFRAEAPLLIAYSYFLINDSYKRQRNQNTLTDDYKKAAVSAIAVMALRPFEPLQPDFVEDDLTYFINPIYAMACANAWLSDRDLLARYPFDYLRRFYLSLVRIRIPSLQPFIDCVNVGGQHTAFSGINLTTDEVDEIEEWIWKFWMLANQKI